MNAYADPLKADSRPSVAEYASGRLALPNKQLRRICLYMMLAALDGAAIAMGLALASLLLFGDALGWQSARLTGIFAPLFVAFALSQRAYSLEALASPGRGALRSMLSLLLATGLALFMLHQIGVLHVFNGRLIACGVVLAAPLLVLARNGMRFLSDWALQNHPVSELVIADDVPVTGAAHQLVVSANHAGLAADLSNPLMLDRVGQLVKNVDRVTIACPSDREESWTLILRGTGVTGEVRTSSPSSPDLPFGSEPVDTLADRREAFRLPSAEEVVLKRLLDLFIVIPAILFFAPLLIAVAVAIRLDSPGPILFTQERIGRGNRLFRMYKFRSMHAERSDPDGHVSASRDDDRVTRVGRWLRATSMDELPQLLNILMGSMSLVGPRPHALGSTARGKLFWDIDRRYWLRHACAPGLTGLAQVRGYRGATDQWSDLENRLASDLEYMRNWSLWLDLVILVRTFGVVVHRNAF